MENSKNATKKKSKAKAAKHPKKTQAKKRPSKIFMDEEFQICIAEKIDLFLINPDEVELPFPSTLTKIQRAFIHEYVKDKSLKSRSYGKSPTRHLVLFKPTKSVSIHDATFEISEETRHTIFELLKTHPLKNRERADLDPKTIKSTNNTKIPPYRFSVGTFSESIQSVPPHHVNKMFTESRQNLPVFGFRDEVLRQVNENQVVVISGETGSGKTTQIPQYILEDCAARREKCRIICTQPRRLAAVAVADRVANERGENIGQTVGYQIRLESRTSPNSNLIYCTNGILLRCLMRQSGSDTFSSITHVIVDEVHERDKFSDFLLISLKAAVKEYPHLKVILMSATIESDTFAKYFYDCEVLTIPGRVFPVTSYLLDEILPMINYNNCNTLIEWKPNDSNDPSLTNSTSKKNKEELIIDDAETIALLNETLEGCAKCADVNEYFNQFFYLVEGEDIPVDFRHTETDMTALMIAAGKGELEIIKALLNLGADPQLKSRHGLSAVDWATHMQQQNCVQILMEHSQLKNVDSANNENHVRILDNYLKSLEDDRIDYPLIYAIIRYIHINKRAGSILVFLPGYENIIEVNEMILRAITENDIDSNLKIYMLHSSMSSIDQRDVFKRAPHGIRKIILSTNIAETSITIDDVVFVIDAGKVKQKSYDSISDSTCLAATWISQACATQRSGRAGRTSAGECYKLYSRTRWESMQKYTIPEMLRVPLTEICLQSKLIAPNMDIEHFLAQSIQPPSIVTIKHSISLLKAIGALDEHENLTELGAHLVDLPVDVQLGKTLIYSIILKCLDPVLSIVSALTVKDPFILPSNPSDRTQAVRIKKKLSENSESDHMAMLKVFQKWMEAKSKKYDKEFCRESFLSSGNMEMISGIRSQILGYLRAVGLIQSHGPGNIHDLNRNSENWALVKGCFVAGLYPNICRVNQKKNVLMSKMNKNVKIHPSSVLRSNQLKKDNFQEYPSDWLIFEEKTKRERMCFIQTNTVVNPVSIALFAGPLQQDEKTAIISYSSDDSMSEPDDEIDDMEDRSQFVVDDWISFNLDTETAFMLFHLRQKMSALFIKFIHNPRNFFKTENDSKIIFVVGKVLSLEDHHHKFVQPIGIGDRPKAVVLEHSTVSNYNGSRESESDMLARQTKKIGKMNIGTNQMRSTSNSYQRSQTASGSQQQQQRQSQQSSKTFFPNNDGNQGWRANKYTQQQQQQQPTQRSIRKQGKKSTTPPNLMNQLLPPNQTKYYIVKAASQSQVYKTFETNQWNFSTSILKNISLLSRINPNVDILIFFHVANSNEFVGAGKFKSTLERYWIECLSRNCIKFETIRQHFAKFPHVKSLEHSYDGDELTDEVGQHFWNLLSTTSGYGLKN